MKKFFRIFAGSVIVFMAGIGALWADYDPSVPKRYSADEGVDARVSGVVQLTTGHSLMNLNDYAANSGYTDFLTLSDWPDKAGDLSQDDWASCWGNSPWSSDGEWIIYTSNIPFIKKYPEVEWDCDNPDPGGLRKAYHHAVCRIRPDGTGYQQMTGNEKGESHGSFLGPVENNTIVFQRGSDIWLKDMSSWTEPDLVVDACQGEDFDAPKGEINLTAAHAYEAGIKQLSADESEDGEVEKYEGEDETAGEQKPVPSPDGTKIAFHRQGKIWTIDADGRHAVNISGKRVDIPESGANIIFEPSGSGFSTYMKTEGFEWEARFGTLMDICCGDKENAAIPFNTFEFPFAGRTYTSAGGTDGDFEWDGNLHISHNGFVSLGGSNADVDGDCNNGGPDKLLNGNYARIAAFWTHLARQLHVETDFSDQGKIIDGEGECPDYGVYINAFDAEGNPVPVITKKQYEGGSLYTTQCCYDYFYAFDNPLYNLGCVSSCAQACEAESDTYTDQCCENDCRIDCADEAGCYTECIEDVISCIVNNTNGAGDCFESCMIDNDCQIPEPGCIELCKKDDCEAGEPVDITRMVITWHQMKLIDNDKRVSIQLQLFNDGRIVMGYDFGGDPDYEINSSKKVIIGVAPGNPGFERPNWVYNGETGQYEYNYDWQAAAYPNPYADRIGIDLTDYTADNRYNSDGKPVVYEFFYKLHGATKHSWSPDGQWVLFNGNPGCALFPNLFEGLELHGYCQGGKQRIFKAKPDGSELVMLSELGNAGDYCDNWATWNTSKTNPAIAFSRNENGKYGSGDEKKSIRLIDPSGNLIKELLVYDPEIEDSDWICGPTSWSPDSKWLAVKKDYGNIFAVDVENASAVQLTNGLDDKRMWWSPDPEKQMILFLDRWGESRDEEQYDSDLLIVNFTLNCTAGDTDGDGDSDVNDLNFLLSLLNKPAPEGRVCADQNEDGMITILDIRQLLIENPLLARDRRLRTLLR